MQWRVSGEPVAVPQEDIEVAMRYAEFASKGEVVAQKRRTIMTRKARYAPGEQVRVIHVFEVLAKGIEMEAMGPKPVFGEYLDQEQVTPSAPGAGLYDGPLVVSPAVDFFFDVTTYRFEREGVHSLYWQPDAVRSNTLHLVIEA